MKPCRHCSGGPKLLIGDWHAIKADGMPAFGKTYAVKCTRCMCITDYSTKEYIAVEDWQAGRVRFPEIGFG